MLTSSFLYETPTKVQPDQEGFMSRNSIQKDLKIHTGFQPIEVSYKTYAVETNPVSHYTSPGRVQDELQSLTEQVDKLLIKSSVQGSDRTPDYLSKPVEYAREVKSSYTRDWEERPMSFGLPQTYQTETYELPRSYLEQEKKSSISTPIANRSFETYKIFDYLSKPAEKEQSVKSSTMRHWEDKPLRTEPDYYTSLNSHVSHPIYTTRSASQYKPSFDEERLNKIVSRIVNRPVESYGNKRDTTLSNVILDREFQKEKTVQSKPQYIQPKTPVEPVARQDKSYFCGDMENDKDSVVGGHIQQAVNDMNEKKQLYTNYYAGNMQDDIDDVPRKRRVGRRQEVRSIKRLQAEDAKRFFLEDESKLEDFDFSRHN